MTEAADERAEILAELEEVTDPAYPVTTPVNRRFPTFTRNNAREIFPDVATPSTWNSVGGGLERSYGKAHADLGLVPRTPPDAWRYIGLFYGRASLCHSAHSQVNRRSFGAPWWPWARGVQARHGVDSAGYTPPDDLRTWAQDLVWRVRAIPKVRRAARELPGHVDDLGSELERVVAESEALDYEAMSFEELLERLGGASIGAEILEAHLQVTFFAGSYYALLERRLRAWTDLPPGPTAAGLLVGLGALESTKPAMALVELAEDVRGAARLAELLRDGDLEGFAAALEDPETDEERSVAEGREAFLGEYGHRSVGEAEMKSRTWAEDPRQIDRILALHLRTSSDSRREDPEERRRDLEARVLSAVSGWQGPFLQRAIDGAQRFSTLRERTKSLTVRNGAKNKRLVREIGRRFLDRGLVHEKDELTMLTRDELLDAPNRSEDDLRALVDRRRRAYELFSRLELPEETFRAPPTPRLSRDPTDKEAGEAKDTPEISPGDVLHGMGVSPGTVTGLVRVVMDPRGDVDLEPGEILVAPYTDAAWAPLFMAAAGVVVDTGGMISHGAIVARDLGLPAVVDVPGTERLRTGDRVAVDGSDGEIHVLERSKA